MVDEFIIIDILKTYVTQTNRWRGVFRPSY